MSSIAYVYESVDSNYGICCAYSTTATKSPTGSHSFSSADADNTASVLAPPACPSNSPIWDESHSQRIYRFIHSWLYFKCAHRRLNYNIKVASCQPVDPKRLWQMHTACFRLQYYGRLRGVFFCSGLR